MWHRIFNVTAHACVLSDTFSLLEDICWHHYAVTVGPLFSPNGFFSKRFEKIAKDFAKTFLRQPFKCLFCKTNAAKAMPECIFGHVRWNSVLFHLPRYDKGRKIMLPIGRLLHSPMFRFSDKIAKSLQRFKISSFAKCTSWFYSLNISLLWYFWFFFVS